MLMLKAFRSVIHLLYAPLVPIKIIETSRKSVYIAEIIIII